MKELTIELEQVFGTASGQETGLMIDTFDGAGFGGNARDCFTGGCTRSETHDCFTSGCTRGEVMREVAASICRVPASA